MGFVSGGFNFNFCSLKIYFAIFPEILKIYMLIFPKILKI